jgi:hypothetical protein
MAGMRRDLVPWRPMVAAASAGVLLGVGLIFVSEKLDDAGYLNECGKVEIGR